LDCRIAKGGGVVEICTEYGELRAMQETGPWPNTEGKEKGEKEEYKIIL
jgi:hypothetical protein